MTYRQTPFSILTGRYVVSPSGSMSPRNHRSNAAAARARNFMAKDYR